MPERLKVYIWPHFGQEGDPAGDGGVRRVVEAQRRHLPAYGIDVVDTAAEADVLAAHMTAPPEFFTHLSHLPLVAHCHGFYWEEYPWEAWAQRDNREVMRLVLAADAVTGPSEWVSRIIRRHTARPCVTVHHGVQTFESLPPDAFGEVVPDAGQYVLWNKTRVDSICDPQPVLDIARRMPDVRFHSTFLPEGAQQPPNVELLGRQGYAAAIREVRAAGVYLSTARETFGIGTLEAMAAGIPVVGFRHGGNEEIVTHLRDGYLAEPGDLDDLERGIRWALAYRDTVGAWGRETTRERFTWNQAAEQYAQIYRQAHSSREADRAAPKVSVIVTAYGLEQYLPAALASVQTQTMDDWECVVVDDASPDGCGAIADEFAARDGRFRVIHNTANQYLAAARNTGIEAAAGRYILPLDADDMLAPNTLELLSHYLDAERDIHVAYGGVRFINPDGSPTIYRGHEAQPGRSGWPVDYSLDLMATRPGQPLPYCSMYRRHAWERTGGYRARVRSSEDCDFWMRLGQYGFRARMVTQAETLIYRNRPDSMSAAGWADVENKRWFPWTRDMRALPAGGRGDRMAVPLWDPRVTVIIPVGPGHEELVWDALDSLEAQTDPRWECVLVDDTGGELETWRLPTWVEVLDVRQAHEGERDVNLPAGVSRARNLGLQAARAPYVMFLDADDYLQPEAIAYHLFAQKEMGGQHVIYSDFWSEYQDGRQVMDPTRDYDCQIVLRQSLHAVTALYPTEAVRAVGGFEVNRPWEDWDLQLKLASRGVCSTRLAFPAWTYRKDTGRRREDRFARREDGKATMLAVWGDYMEGRKQLAGCSSCGSNARTVFAPNAAGMRTAFNAAPENMPDAVMVEYLGEGSGKQSISGPSKNQGGTGTRYMFQPGRKSYVHQKDLTYFLNRGMVKLVPVEDGQTAAGATGAPPPPAPALSVPGRTMDRHPAGQEATPPGLRDVPPPPPPPVGDLPAELAVRQDPAARRPPPVSLQDLPPPPEAPPSAFESTWAAQALPPPPAPPPLNDEQLSVADQIRAQLAAADLTPEPESTTTIDTVDAVPEMTREPIGDNGDIVEPTPAPAAKPAAKPKAAAASPKTPPRNGRK